MRTTGATGGPGGAAADSTSSNHDASMRQILSSVLAVGYPAMELIVTILAAQHTNYPLATGAWRERQMVRTVDTSSGLHLETSAPAKYAASKGTGWVAAGV